MLITLLSIALTTMLSVPIARKVLKEIRKDPSQDHEELQLSTQEDEHAMLMDFEEPSDLLSFDLATDEDKSIQEDASQPTRKSRTLVQVDWSNAEHLLVTPTPTSKSSSHSKTLPTKKNAESKKTSQQDTKIPWHEPWKASSADSKTKEIHSEHKIDQHRRTPSADELFATVEQSPPKVMSTISEIPTRNKNTKTSRPRNIQPLKRDKVSTINVESKENHAVLKDQNTEKHLLHAKKQRLSQVQIQAKAKPKRKSPIKMLITEAPSALPKREHFEVITPEKNNHKKVWRTRGEPEQIISGERSWMSMTPMYIDFSTFFSLDALRSIEDISPFQRIKAPSNIQGSQDEMDDFEDEYFEDQNVPEWQFLLGQVNGFLFNLKLKQQRIPHVALNEQDLEESVSFEISNRVEYKRQTQNLESPDDFMTDVGLSLDERKTPMITHPLAVNSTIKPSKKSNPSFSVTEQNVEISQSKKNPIRGVF